MYILLVKKNDNVFDTVYTMHLDMRSFIKKICNGEWLVHILTIRLTLNL